MSTQYKQKQVAKYHGVQSIRVSRWTPEEMKTNGWDKHGEGQGCYYTRLDGLDIDLSTTESDLRRKKLEIEIEEKEQKLERKKRAMFQEWSGLYMAAFMESFAPLKDALIASRFDEENTDKWNKAIDECIKSLTANPQIIKTVEKTLLTFTAVDPEGDSLTYHWSASFGFFTKCDYS